MNKQNIFIGLAIGLVLAGIGLYFVLPEDNTKKSLSDEMIFYYGDTCPHCQKVEEYVAQNNVQEKVPFEKKEVYNNEENAKELARTAQQCGLEKSKIGVVPLLWTGKNCLVGDKDIIAFFAEKIGDQPNN
jgi:glutaredoxin